MLIGKEKAFALLVQLHYDARWLFAPSLFSRAILFLPVSSIHPFRVYQRYGCSATVARPQRMGTAHGCSAGLRCGLQRGLEGNP